MENLNPEIDKASDFIVDILKVEGGLYELRKLEVTDIAKLLNPVILSAVKNLAMENPPISLQDVDRDLFPEENTEPTTTQEKPFTRKGIKDALAFLLSQRPLPQDM